MRHLIILTLAVAGLLPAQAMAQKPALGVTLIECSTGATEPERSLTVSAAMPVVSGATMMKMRFELHQRLAGADNVYERVRLPLWATWIKSAPGVPGLVVQRKVDSLVAGARYKVLVRFRWFDADGKRLKARLRTSKACVQPGPATAVTPGV